MFLLRVFLFRHRLRDWRKTDEEPQSLGVPRLSTGDQDDRAASPVLRFHVTSTSVLGSRFRSIAPVSFGI